MAELLKVKSKEMREEIEKQLNDRSYNGANESGMGEGSVDITEDGAKSQEAVADSSGYGSSGRTEWEDFEGEIVNLSTFQLECMHSSNVARKVADCEISSIAHENGTPHLRKGNFESKLNKRLTVISQTENTIRPR